MMILQLMMALSQALQAATVGGLLDMESPIELSTLGAAHRQALKDAADALAAQSEC
jgi:hypothetical protein